MDRRLIGVDVGTASARAGVLTAEGAVLGAAESPIPVHASGEDAAEQSAEAVWRAVCAAVRGAMAESATRPDAIAAIGFCATASLVARDADGGPLPVGETADCDVILWRDHRARAEAAEIGGRAPELAAQAGGAVSPEMQGPKLLWLKRNRPDLWARSGLLLDLCDFLSWRASGSTARSACAIACKWPWIDGWSDALLERIGLSDLRARAGISGPPVPPGTDLGPLTPAAAADLGLGVGCRVAAGLIDAHAAALGMLGRAPQEGLALVAGTSACVMGLRAAARPAPGVWGPYANAVLPDLSVVESGQSAAGAALDSVIRRFGGRAPDAAAHAEVAAMARALRERDGPGFAADIHVLPDFLGARGPAPDAAARAVVAGLPLDDGPETLARLYWRTCVALALGLREAVEALTGAPAAAATLHFGGGHARSDLLSALYAEAIGAAIVPHGARAPSLRGAAAAAAVAGGLAPDLAAAAAAMAKPGAALPADPARARLYDRDLAALRLLRAHRDALAALTGA